MEDILAALVCANSQEFDSLCCSYALGFFFFGPTPYLLSLFSPHRLLHLNKGLFGSNGCWH